MVCVPVRSFVEGIIDRTGAQTLLYLTCTMISTVDLAHYGVSHAKDCVSVDCGTMYFYTAIMQFAIHKGKSKICIFRQKAKLRKTFIKLTEATLSKLIKHVY